MVQAARLPTSGQVFQPASLARTEDAVNSFTAAHATVRQAAGGSRKRARDADASISGSSSPARAPRAKEMGKANPLELLFSLAQEKDDVSGAPVKRMRRASRNDAVDSGHSYQLSSFLETLADAKELSDGKTDVLATLCGELDSIPEPEKPAAFQALITAAIQCDKPAELLSQITGQLVSVQDDVLKEPSHTPKTIGKVFEMLRGAATQLTPRQNEDWLPGLVSAIELLPHDSTMRAFNWFADTLDAQIQRGLTLPQKSDAEETDNEEASEVGSDAESSAEEAEDSGQPESEKPDVTHANTPELKAVVESLVHNDPVALPLAALADAAVDRSKLVDTPPEPLPHSSSQPGVNPALPVLTSKTWVNLATELAKCIAHLPEQRRVPAFDRLRATVRASDILSPALVSAMARAPRSFSARPDIPSFYS